MSCSLKDSPSRAALRDIARYLKERNIKVFDSRDTWVVTGSRLYNKKQRQLNKGLGIHAINKTKYNMTRY